MGGGGDRPKNHIPARFVTVVDRASGYIKYFCLDQKGSLVYENGEPKLDHKEPFRPAGLTVCQAPIPTFARSPVCTSAPMPIVTTQARATALDPPEVSDTLMALSDETYEYRFWGPDDEDIWM